TSTSPSCARSRCLSSKRSLRPAPRWMRWPSTSRLFSTAPTKAPSTIPMLTSMLRWTTPLLLLATAPTTTNTASSRPTAYTLMRRRPF
ncbi:hypothetical protein GGI11_006732, partial [Coemansia sp. RSA 2049]